MNQQENLAIYFAEMLAKQNATPEEKKIQALIKAALYGDNLLRLIVRPRFEVLIKMKMRRIV